MGYIFMQWDDLWPELMKGPLDPETDPADSTKVLRVPRDVVAENKPGTYQVLEHLETSGFSATGGPQIRFKDFRVPGANLLEAARTAALVGAIATGIMAVAFEAALTFAKSDARGGSQALLARQSVSDLWMNVETQTDAARAMSW
ncbi:uncharacterized protein RAG0_13725 [Rhynchosporium agropyri]|uniref:Acyl-CoA dehydrogenase/oxidase C-terminal domain-containing protein n=1 Tax=Rhynchosporium agropyri TaxID=914238 RepID=A0A1E1LE52_9HELO|nr:uncharacterized protein RAG0_13725 [Rhynchosporium agropyri]